MPLQVSLGHCCRQFPSPQQYAAPLLCYACITRTLHAVIYTLLAPVPHCCTTHLHGLANLAGSAALQEKRIRGAGLDVVYTEPLPKDSPLWELDNVLLSPHCADRTTTFQAEAIQQFTELAKLYVEGKELFNVVDKETGY